MNAPDRADFRVTVTVRNERLLAAIERAGFESIPKFCEASGLHYSTVIQYAGLKLAPISSKGEWRRSAENLAFALKTLPEDLFPERFLRKALASNKVSRTLTESQMLELTEARNIPVEDPETRMIAREQSGKLDAALARLPARDRDIIERRFGLNGKDEETLEQIGKRYGITSTAIRFIEGRALRALKATHNKLDRLDLLISGNSASSADA